MRIFQLTFRSPPKSMHDKLKEISFIPLEFDHKDAIRVKLPSAINYKKDKIQTIKVIWKINI